MTESNPNSANARNVKDLTIGEARFVNDATLELLEARIKSGVIRNFMKFIGIPVGGGALIALGTALFVWFPKHASEAIEKHVDEEITKLTARVEFRENLRRSVEENLDSDIGRSIIAAEVENAVQSKMPALVGALLKTRLPEQLPAQVGEQLPGLVAERLPDEMKRFLNSEQGTADLERMVVEYLQAGDGRELLIKELGEVLKPIVERIGQQVGTNQKARISAFSETLRKLSQYKKGSYFELDGFLHSQEAQKIAESGQPIVLTKTIRTNFPFVREAIHAHIDAFRQAFGARFLGIAIFDEDERTLLAFVDDQRFAEQLDRNNALIELLRASDGEITREQAVELLRTWFGESAVSFVPTQWLLGQTLRSPRVWRQPATLDQCVAIVDAGSGQMVAAVSRRELVGGLLD